jgi:hypothetical protein
MTRSRSTDPNRAEDGPSGIDSLQVQRRLDKVMQSLVRAAGGAALCRIDLGSVKNQEGRAAALQEVRRLLRRTPGASPEPIAARWRADLDRHRERGSSAAWLEYLSGGVDELGRLAAQSGEGATGARAAGERRATGERGAGARAAGERRATGERGATGADAADERDAVGADAADERDAVGADAAGERDDAGAGPGAWAASSRAGAR